MPVRFDSRALHAARDEHRTRRSLRRADVAREIGISSSSLAGTKRDGRLEVDGVLAMTSWLAVPRLPRYHPSNRGTFTWRTTPFPIDTFWVSRA